MFLFTDMQIKEEGFLEDVNNLLNSGEVPNLYPVDEKQEIIEKMRQIDKVLAMPYYPKIIKITRLRIYFR